MTGSALLFDEKVAPHLQYDANGGCWLWSGPGVSQSGYGSFSNQGRNRLVHRLSFETFHGPIPAGLFVCHRCDVRLCCNPDHLFTGTSLDNVKDMVAKNRQAKGEKINTAKLTLEQVLEIRASPLSRPALFRKYGMSRTTIFDILERKTWRHV